MKILIVGSKKEWALENHYIKHLSSLGVEVGCYDAHDIFYDFYHKSRLNKVLFRSGLSKIYDSINEDLIQIVEENKYTIVWVFKGMEIFPKTLKTLKTRDVHLVNFNPDHPFLYNFKGSGNSNVLNSIGLFDLHLCYNLAVKHKIEDEFKIKSVWLPFGYEEANVILPQEKDEILRACFIGNPDKFRVDMITNLAQNGVPLSLYGNDWKNWIKPQRTFDIKYHSAVYKSDFNKIASKYRVQLNIFRHHNENSHNMRTFEMPGLGCIMLAPRSEDHAVLFENGSEILMYENQDELLSLTKKVLNFDYNKALNFRGNALKRSVNSGYSYKARTKLVFDLFKGISNEK